MKKNRFLLLCITLCLTNLCFSQETEKETKFSQPLYLDLPGELNVKKGYKEVTSLLAAQSFKEYHYYRLAVEYAFSPADNLGLEIEIPANLYSKKDANAEVENKIEAVRIGGMYSLPNLGAKNAAVSFGFVNDFEFNSFENFGKPLFDANTFHPFVSVAKVWNKKFTGLIFLGPNFHTYLSEKYTKTELHINTTLGYQLGEKENFINLETNQIVYKGKLETLFRPQVRLHLADKWALGLGITIPAADIHEGAGGFLRLILRP